MELCFAWDETLVSLPEILGKDDFESPQIWVTLAEGLIDWRQMRGEMREETRAHADTV